MNHAVRCLLLATFAMSALAAVRGDDPPPRDSDLELLLRTGEGPLVWRWRVEVDGEPLADRWAAAFSELYDFADSNGDGDLDVEETRLLPSPHGVRQTLWGQFLSSPSHIRRNELDLDGDGRIDLPEVTAYYAGHGLGRVLVAVGRAPATAALNRVLAKELGLVEGQPVAEERWHTAVRSLARLDRNGDELISPGELVPAVRYPGASPTELLLSSHPGVEHSQTADALPVVIPPVDEGLQAATVWNWETRLGGRRDETDRRLEVVEPTDVRFDSKSERHRATSLPGVSLRIRFDEGTSEMARFEPLAIVRRQYREVDFDGTGHVDAERLQAHPQLRELRKLRSLADRDRDGRLSNDELERWLRLQHAFVRSGVVLSLLDHGRGLFELIDENYDGSLSRTELSLGRDRLTAHGGLDGKGGYASVRLPRQLRLTIAPGLPDRLLDGSASTGPAWFRAMDRNGDGRLSRSEFLGGDSVFESLDRNTTGEIDQNEAETSVPTE